MTLKNVQTIEKPPKDRYTDHDAHALSSDIRVYNLFDQSWDDLKAEELSWVFNDNKAEFEARKANVKEGMTNSDTEHNEAVTQE